MLDCTTIERARSARCSQTSMLVTRLTIGAVNSLGAANLGLGREESACRLPNSDVNPEDCAKIQHANQQAWFSVPARPTSPPRRCLTSESRARKTNRHTPSASSARTEKPTREFVANADGHRNDEIHGGTTLISRLLRNNRPLRWCHTGARIAPERCNPSLARDRRRLCAWAAVSNRVPGGESVQGREVSGLSPAPLAVNETTPRMA